MLLTRKNWWKFAITFIAGCLVMLGIMGVLRMNNFISNTYSPTQKSASKVFVNEKDLKEFKLVKIISPSDNINFVPSDYYGLEICEPDYFDEPKWSVENGQLEIQTHSNNSNFRLSNSEKGYINIYYPKNGSFENIFIDVSSGNINIHGTRVKKLKINLNSGNINAAISDCDEISAHNKSGNINIKNNSETPTTVNAETTSGNIEIYCNGDIADYSYNASSTVGSIIINGKQFNKLAKSSNQVNANSIVAKVVTGNITIDFKR